MRRGEKGRGRWARGGVGMVGLLMACSQAGAEDDALSRLILENRYEMAGSHDALSGSGLEFLLAEARDSEFVLIGENHLTDQIPRMTGRLVRELRPAGFDVLAVETGHASTRRMVDLLRRGGVPGFRERVVSYPWQTDNFENNRRRTGRLAGRTGGAGRPPRVLMKLGSFHTGRALSPVNQLDVGNLAHQLAFLRGGHSLHVWSTALVNRQPDGTVSDLATPGSAVEPLARHVGNGPWTVFDVRPLRSWFQSSRNREAHPAFADAVCQHDLILITREFTRSRSLLDEAGRMRSRSVARR